MKNFKIIIIALCTIALFTCERDDLCDEDTPTTPRMIFEFRDLANPESTKDVMDLRVEDPDDSSHFLTDYNGTTDELQMILPLKTERNETLEGETQYVVYKDYAIDDNGTPDDTSDDFPTGNSDVITITYKVIDVYVSRACSYKTTYENVVVTIVPDGDNWMLFEASTNDNQSVLNEDETHWTIRH
jgi:hypothetical protein